MTRDGGFEPEPGGSARARICSRLPRKSKIGTQTGRVWLPTDLPRRAPSARCRGPSVIVRVAAAGAAIRRIDRAVLCVVRASDAPLLDRSPSDCGLNVRDRRPSFDALYRPDAQAGCRGCTAATAWSLT